MTLGRAGNKPRRIKVHDDPAAALSAHAGMAVFRTSYEQWVRAPDEESLTELIDRSLAVLRDVAVPRGAAAPTA